MTTNFSTKFPQETMPSVSIVVLNWNGLQDTRECLNSLLLLNYPDYSIILVDNASTDGSGAALRNEYPNVTLIENTGNLGFSEGNNVGIRYALAQGADYVWILNNDTIVDPFALTTLLEAAEADSNIGILGSKIYYYDEPDILWFAGGPMDWKSIETPHIGGNEKDIGQYNDIKDYDRVAGCSMMVSRKLCDKIGLMDPAYFLYVEEVDWCLRARADGFRVVYVPDSKVYHKVSRAIQLLGAPDEIFSYYKTRNLLYLLKKNFKAPMSYMMMFRFLCKSILQGRPESKKMRPMLIGTYDFILGRMGRSNRTSCVREP